MAIEKYELSLGEARKRIQTASHILLSTYPFAKENKILLQALEEIHGAMAGVIKSVLQFEYLYKRVTLYSDAQSNFETFLECAPRYNISIDELKKIKHVFLLVEKHKRSPMEFVRKDKVVILSDNLKTDFITFDLMRHYLSAAKDIANKAESFFIKKAY